MSTAIIGTGIGGLTTALLLTKAGKQVTMYEKQSHVGGRLTFEKHGEYRIDQGPTIVLLPDMLLSILEDGDFPIQSLDLVRCDPSVS